MKAVACSGGRLAVLVVLFGCSGAYGELITVTFDGQLSHIDTSLAGRFSLGDAMHASITYESTTADEWWTLPNDGYYRAITSIDVSVAGYTASGSDGHWLVQNDRSGADTPQDSIFAQVYAHSGGTLVGPDVDGMPLSQFFLQLHDTTGTALNSELLPTSFDPSLFNTNQLALIFRNVTDHGTYNDRIVAEDFTSTSSYIPVPLPGALLLGSLGVATVGWLCRRRKV